VDDSDQTVTIGRVARSNPPAPAGGLWADHGLADGEPVAGAAADGPAGLASLSFITAAIRRRTRVWCLAAVAGLLLGSGLYVLHPPRYEASTEILLVLGPNEDLNTQIQTDAALARSRPVAAIALQKLGLNESINSLLASFTALPLTNRILVITVSASSASGAVSQASAVSQAFLQYRARQLRNYEGLVTASLKQQLTQTKTQVSTLSGEVKAQTPKATTPDEVARLQGLEAQLSRARSTLASLEQSAQSSQQNTLVATNSAVKGSQIVDSATLIVKSRKKTAVIYALTAMIAGAILGLGYIAIAALVSDRLRRRDDVAYVLGAPVRLSTGRWRRRRLLPGHRGLAGTGNPDIRRITRHLDGLASVSGANGLAVIPTDRPDAAALATVALALSCAQQGKQVVIADLCEGTPVARLLKTAKPGVHRVEVEGATLTVVVPEREDATPAGPVTLASRSAHPPATSADVIAAHSSADTLLTIASLDPMLGAEHLATWAISVVVVVTAGGSSWTRVQSVGEMIRMAGLRLASAVLVGADRTDESLGVSQAAPRISSEHQSADGGLAARVNGSPSRVADDVMT
jgi:uncharacterized protein involved in exopolysaccharide biosynthesis